MMNFLRSLSFVEPAILFALFVAGSLAGRALDLPVPAPVAGVALVLLGLRIGVMATAAKDASEAPRGPTGPDRAREPALRAAS